MTVRQFMLLSLKHSSGDVLTWWRPNSAGYCQRLEDAGRYTQAEAERICGGLSEGDTVAVPLGEVLAQASTYVRMTWRWGVPVRCRRSVEAEGGAS